MRDILFKLDTKLLADISCLLDMELRNAFFNPKSIKKRSRQAFEQSEDINIPNVIHSK